MDDDLLVVRYETQDIATAPREGHILLLLGETIPDVPDWRVGSYIDPGYAEEMGYREYAKYGGWMIWNSDCDWFVIDVIEPRAWCHLPRTRSSISPETK